MHKDLPRVKAASGLISHPAPSTRTIVIRLNGMGFSAAGQTIRFQRKERPTRKLRLEAESREVETFPVADGGKGAGSHGRTRPPIRHISTVPAPGA